MHLLSASVSYTVQLSEGYCTKRILVDDIVLTVSVSYVSVINRIALVICCYFYYMGKSAVMCKCNYYTGLCCDHV